jgi:hypothetical protein
VIAALLAAAAIALPPAVAYARRLVRRGHRAGLAVAQKNTVELDGRKAGFDFAVAEECGR